MVVINIIFAVRVRFCFAARVCERGKGVCRTAINMRGGGGLGLPYRHSSRGPSCPAFPFVSGAHNDTDDDDDDDEWNYYLRRNSSFDSVSVMRSSALSTVLADWLIIFTVSPVLHRPGTFPATSAAPICNSPPLPFLLDRRNYRLSRAPLCTTPWSDYDDHGASPLIGRTPPRLRPVTDKT